MCDVDSRMLSEAAGMVAQRQASKKKPRTYSDYRKMLAEKDLDIVLVETPDHWHALAAIAAMQAGADVWCQKPISVDVVEGQAMLAAARKYKRVVQINTQRRSTPHLVEAQEPHHRRGQAGQDRDGRALLLLPHARRPPIRPTPPRPPTSITRCGPAPRPCAPITASCIRGSWRAFMEYGNGIVGDMCIHMFDMARWMLGLGWPTRISSSGGILVDKASKANITDTQTATFEYPDLQDDLAASHLGRGARSQVPVGRHLLRRQGHAQSQRLRATTSLPLRRANSRSTST